MFRTSRMTWVDLLVDPDAVGVVLERLAAAGIFEPRRAEGAPPFDANREIGRERLDQMARRLEPYVGWLPTAEPPSSSAPPLPVEDLVSGIEQAFAQWLDAAVPAITAARLARAELEEWRLFARLLGALPDAAVDFAGWPAPGEKRVYAPFIATGPAMAAENAAADQILAGQTFPLPGDESGAVAVLGMVATGQLPTLERQWHASGMRFVNVPPGLRGPASEALAQLRARIARAEARLGAALTQVDRANRQFRIGRARWLFMRCLWTHRILGEQSAGGRHFVWLGGWTPRRRLAEMEAILRASGVAHLLGAESAAERRSPPPVELFNPRFATRFEVFVRAFGMPAGAELDPSPALAMLMPLLFGYMFGDVGHGLVLALVGRYAGRRTPVLKLLVPAGAVSMVFGFVYGEIFGLEHILPALGWRPLDAPLLTLLLPLGAGLLILLLGAAFEIAQARAAGGMRAWWLEEFPALALFAAALAALLSMPLAGLLALCAFAVLLSAVARPALLAGRVVEALHGAMQLAVNTVSFMRVGAFALAHAGLSAAVHLLAQMPDSAAVRGGVWLFGNALVIGLEGLVVSVQTTRLMLFEFFRRFLHGGGRPFEPLTLPPELARHSYRIPSTQGALP